MRKKNTLTASLEDYLETIYKIIEEKQAARVKEIAGRLGVQNSSVTGALKNLSRKGYINYAPYDVITLTETGEKTALDVIRRHEVMKKFIVDILCIDDLQLADGAACEMEHSVPPEILERIVRFVEFAEICPRSGQEWISGFRRFCKSDFSLDMCRQGAEKCVGEILDNSKQCALTKKDTVPLTTLGVREKGRLIRIESENGIGKHLTDIGVTPGSLFEIESISPQTGDIYVGVRGYHLTIRNYDAESIMVIPYS